jgi:hypothetical protein
MAVINQLDTRTVTITSGGTLASAVSIDGLAVVGIITPTAWTAAAITFDVSYDGVTYVPFWKDDGEVDIPSAQISTSAARFFALNPADWVGLNYVKVRSGIKGTEVAQGAARALTLVVKPI